jgi:hypothetical protein
MKMNKIANGVQDSNQRSRHLSKLTHIIVSTGLALASLSAQAQFSPASGDVILDLSKTGASDLEVDVGNISTFLSQAPGTTVVLGGSGLNYYTSTELATDFGSGGSSLDGVKLTAIATTASTVDFFTVLRSDPAQQNSTPGNVTPSTLSNIHNAIAGVSSAAASWSLNPTAGALNTASAVEIPNGNVDSFTTHLPGITGYTGTQIVNTTPSGFTGTPGDSIASDLFEYSAGHVTYVGDFTFNSDGTTDFSTAPSAVPEPSTYGLIAAAGLLLLAMKNQVRRYLAA